MKRKLSFPAACAFELSLLLWAFIWGRLFDRRVFADFKWDARAPWIGVAATIPIFIFFFFTFKSKSKLFREHNRLMETRFRDMLCSWSVIQIAVISVGAGLSEEALFRGAIQGSLAERVGVVFAVLLGSLAFGACHLITYMYGIIVAVFGVYFAVEWIWTGNLLAPMITHAVYDFGALVYLVKIHRPAPE